MLNHRHQLVAVASIYGLVSASDQLLGTVTDRVFTMAERSRCTGNATDTALLCKSPDDSQTVRFKCRHSIYGARASCNRFMNFLFTVKPADWRIVRLTMTTTCSEVQHVTCEQFEHTTSATTSDLMKSIRQLCREHWMDT